MRKWLYILIDIAVIIVSFLVFAWLKPGTRSVILPSYWEALIYFTLIWVLISIFLGKYDLEKVRSSRDVIIPFLICNFTILSVVSILIYSFQVTFFSRFIVFGTIGLATFLEIDLGLIFNIFLHPVRIDETRDVKLNGQVVVPPEGPIREEVAGMEGEAEKFLDDEAYGRITNMIIIERGREVLRFIEKVADLRKSNNLIIATTTRFNILNQPDNEFYNVINLKRINDIRYINKFMEAVNNKIPYGGIFIDYAETYLLRKKRILKKYPWGINYLVYTADWAWKRAFPKLPVFKKIYFYVTHGHNRVISKAETFGRLYSCGFTVVREEYIHNCLFFAVKKIKPPAYDYNPTYGPVITLKRYGKGGKLFNVYKFRTMHAYSEYLQEYIYQKYDLADGGKFSNDFRVTTLGRLMRKIWLDEVPMLYNVLKGDMKLVGVRPLSRHYFMLYSEELRKRRIKYKPGLVPPFYVDMPKTLDEIMESEMRYLDAYEKHPFLTDLRYFFIAFTNIVFRQARSR